MPPQRERLFTAATRTGRRKDKGLRRVNNTIVVIVMLAMLAAFLGLRLYSVLGRRTGHEQDPNTTIPPKPAVAIPAADTRRPLDAAPASGRDGNVFEPQAEIALRGLLAQDRSFDAGRFVDGAKTAYRMILEAYWKGDRDTLRSLCDDDSYVAFADAIAAREAAGETLDNRLVAINEARIADVQVEGSLARVTMRFDADIVGVTRDASGTIIAGSVTDAVQTHDRWSFKRTIGSSDPKWLLDETQAD